MSEVLNRHLKVTFHELLSRYVVQEARARKVDVTTEAYPYTAGATLIQSALYDKWEAWPEARFAQLQWAATGERLTRETFAKYRTQGGSVISHSDTEEALRVGIADPLPMFASDGGRDFDDNPTHPRGTGSFARILGHYVRDEKVLIWRRRGARPRAVGQRPYPRSAADAELAGSGIHRGVVARVAPARPAWPLLLRGGQSGLPLAGCCVFPVELMDDLAGIYQRHARALFAYARSLTRNTAEAEDLVSEAFVKAVSKRGAIDDLTVRGYLATTVRHLFLNSRRRSGRESVLDREVTADAPDADRILDSRLRAGRLQAALSDLSLGERHALMLRVRDELPYEQIGHVLGVTTDAAKMRVSRARARLVATLKEKETPREDRD